jgi:hypothetical protein
MTTFIVSIFTDAKPRCPLCKRSPPIVISRLHEPRLTTIEFGVSYIFICLRIYLSINPSVYIEETYYTATPESGWLSRYSDGLQVGRPGKTFSSPQRPDRLSGPPSLLSKVYRRQFPRGVKRPKREADHSPPSSVQFRNGGAVPPLPHIPSWRGV